MFNRLDWMVNLWNGQVQLISLMTDIKMEVKRTFFYFIELTLLYCVETQESKDIHQELIGR